MIGIYNDNIIDYLKDHNKKFVAIRELIEHFGLNQPVISRQIKQLNRYGFVDIIVDSKEKKYPRYLVRLKEDE
jgi:DNA-binding MarR family transcriptional regulator